MVRRSLTKTINNKHWPERRRCCEIFDFANLRSCIFNHLQAKKWQFLNIFTASEPFREAARRSRSPQEITTVAGVGAIALYLCDRVCRREPGDWGFIEDCKIE
jgi:hypothetical protein